MKRTLCFLAAVLSFSVPAFGQECEEISAPKGKVFEYTSAAGALDMVDWLGDYDNTEWPCSRRHMRTIKFYHGQTVKDPSPAMIAQMGANQFRELARVNAFRKITRNFEMATAIEVGAIKPGVCPNLRGFDMRTVSDPIVTSYVNVLKSGGLINRLDIDTATTNCDLSMQQAGAYVAQIIDAWHAGIAKALQTLRETNPELPELTVDVADIEPYPHRSVSDHYEYISQVNRGLVARGRKPLTMYVLDIDFHLVSDEKVLAREVTWIANYVHSQGMKFGIIINGDDESKDKPWNNKDFDYLATANHRLVTYKRTGILDLADVIMVQSWALELNGKKSVPFNSRESEVSGTSFFNHVLRCTAGMSGDCSRYPEPR